MEQARGPWGETPGNKTQRDCTGFMAQHSGIARHHIAHHIVVAMFMGGLPSLAPPRTASLILCTTLAKYGTTPPPPPPPPLPPTPPPPNAGYNVHAVIKLYDITAPERFPRL